MRSSVETSNPLRSEDQKTRATIGWWGLTSVVCGLLAASFLPAALLGGAGWADQINIFWPIWGACCIVGAGTGIHGLQKQRRATRAQRLLAFGGTLFSLLVFIVLTIIALIALN